MFVLHAVGTSAGPVALWAEDGSAPATAGRRRPTAPDPHPFAAADGALRELLALDAGESTILPVLLPSSASAPAASPELVRDPLAAPSAPRGALRVRPWLVPAVLLDGTAALSLVDEQLQEPARFRTGASAHFLTGVVALARNLVGRGKVLPAVVTAEPSSHLEPAAEHQARWLAAPAGLDLVRIAELRAALPPALRAEQLRPGLLDGRTPQDVLRTVLDVVVDALVRERLAARSVRLTPPRRGRIAAAELAADAWLTALTGSPRIAAPPARVAELAGLLDQWRAGADADTRVRTCFRLRSPGHDVDPDALGEHGDDLPWRLEFLLQAVDEPSVLLPARQVWQDQGGVLRRWVAEPEEVLLAGLGRASRMFAGLDVALREAQPVELVFDADGAYEFLRSAAELTEAGFGVLLPSWWQQPVELGLSLTVHSRAATGVVAREDEVGLRALVDYRWELALGDERVTQAELTELAAAKVPLVRLRGRWVHLDPQRLAAGLAFLARAGSGQAPAGELLHELAAPPSDRALPLPASGVRGTGWFGELLSGQAEHRVELVEPPPGFTGSLRPYQQRGLAWLAFLDRLGVGGCLADDMGLGKTVQLLALEMLVRHDSAVAGERRAPTLLVCPMSVVGNWQREAARFAPGLSVHVHHGADRLDGPALAAILAEHDLVLTTYSLVAKDIDSLAAVCWDRVVLDEAQNIKNSAAQQAQAVRRLSARHRLAMTGTPVENRLAELWSIMDFANPGILGSHNTFRARFAVPIERYGDEDAAERLRRSTAPFVLRRLKTDPRIIDDLPEKIEMKQLCNLTTEQASLYQAVVDDMLAKINASDGIKRKGLVLATMSKLKQVCNHPAHFLGDGSAVAGRSGKLARLEEIITEALADGDKVLCFTQFAEFGALLAPHLAARFDTEVLFLHGGTPKGARDEMVRRFQSADGPSIFLLSLKAGGIGLNLTAANHVVHLDRWWNPAVEDQATDRAFRIGQRRDVQVRKLVCIGTLEERIDELIEQKKALAQLVVGSGESWLTELSTTQLRDLLMLAPEAASE